MRALSTKPDITPLALSIPDAAKYLGVSRSLIYLMFADGRLQRVKIGRRALVKVADLDALLDEAGRAA